jgi:hypothetical protein
MRVLTLPQETQEYVWVPITLKMDGVPYVPDDPDISFAFCDVGTKPENSQFSITGNLSFREIDGKASVNFFFDATVFAIGRYDVWIQIVILGEHVKRKLGHIRLV